VAVYFPSQQIELTYSSMESLDDNTTMLEQLEREIVRWSHVVSEMKADDNRRSVIEAKLASWKQKREQLASLLVAELKHNRKAYSDR
jgi:hypothetical protein